MLIVHQIPFQLSSFHYRRAIPRFNFDSSVLMPLSAPKPEKAAGESIKHNLFYTHSTVTRRIQRSQVRLSRITRWIELLTRRAKSLMEWCCKVSIPCKWLVGIQLNVPPTLLVARFPSPADVPQHLRVPIGDGAQTHFSGCTFCLSVVYLGFFSSTFDWMREPSDGGSHLVCSLPSSKDEFLGQTMLLMLLFVTRENELALYFEGSRYLLSWTIFFLNTFAEAWYVIVCYQQLLWKEDCCHSKVLFL